MTHRVLPITFALVASAGLVGAQISTVDSVGNVGQFSSLTIGSDGLPLISYAALFNTTPSNLKVAHCNDLACATSRTITTLDPDDGGNYTSIAVGADGLGLIAYMKATSSGQTLKVAHCQNAACTSATLTPLDTGMFAGIDLAIGSDGLGLISYYDVTNYDLKVAHCNNAACTSATVTTLDPSPARGSYTTVAIGADGLGIIAYDSQPLAQAQE